MDAVTRALHDLASEAFVILAADGTVQYLSSAFESMFGWRLEDVQGRPWPESAPSRDAEGLAAAWERFKKEDVEWEEYQVHHRDGHLVRFECSSARLGSSGAQQVLLVLRPAGETAARARLSLMQLGQDLVGLGTWASEERDGVASTRWSPQMFALMGEEPSVDGVPPRPFQEYLLPEDWASRAATRGRMIQEGGQFQDELRIITPAGDVRWLRTLRSVVPLGPGRARTVGVAQDVTEQVALLEEVQRQNALLRQGERLGGLGFWSRGLKDGEGMRWSEGMYAILGLAPVPEQEPPGAPLGLVHPGDLAGLVPGEDSREMRVVRPDGEARWVRVSSQTLTDELGAPSQVIGMMADVTDEFNALRALRTLSSGNSVLVEASDESELIVRMCQSIVAEGGYTYASYSRPSAHDPDSLAAVAFAGSDRWMGETLASRAMAAFYLGAATMFPDPDLAEDRRQDASAAFLPVVCEGRVDGVLTVWTTEAGAFLGQAYGHLQDLAAHLGYGLARLRDASRLRRVQSNSVELVSAVVEARDPYTSGHQIRVGELSHEIGLRMGISGSALDGLLVAASIHDVGKIAVPSEILSRPGILSAEEMAVVRRHPQVGYEITSRFDWPYPVPEIVRQHHEAFDGSGYPAGLSGDSIMLEARVVAVADAYEAMAHARPYRPAMGHSGALERIRAGSGSQFDPAVVEALGEAWGSGFRFANPAGL